MSSFVCRGRQTTARGGCNVRQSKQIFVEIQKVCDIKQVNSKWSTWQVQKKEKEAKKAQKKEKAENSSVLPPQSEKCLERLEKDIQPNNGLYRELRNPLVRPRKTLVD